MDVSLPEELVLIAYDTQTGRAAGGAAELECGLVGAVLVELALAGRIDVLRGRVVVLSAQPGGEPVIDVALARIAGQRRARQPEWWVRKLRKGLREGVLAGLIERGVLQMRRHRALGLFPVRRYPALDTRLEYDARARVTWALAPGSLPDARTAALASLLNASGLMRHAFPEVGRRELKARMAEIDQGQWASVAVRKAIQSIHPAVAAGAAAAVVASSASS